MSAVSDKDVALLQRNPLAATADPSFPVEVNTGSIKVTASACDLLP
jgi:hypothetical protein